MSDIEIIKIKQFIGDRQMASIVYTLLLNEYLKPIDSEDVQSLAASRLAIDRFREAWKLLEQKALSQQEETRQRGTPHV